MDKNDFSIHEEDYEDIQREFDRLDGDDDGFVDVSEFKRLLGNLKRDQEITTSQAHEAFDRIDDNGDGKISMGEFARWWQGRR